MGAFILIEEPLYSRLFHEVTTVAESSVADDPVIRHMAYHPEYVAVFARTHNFIMFGDGPLPFDTRQYIAIMAAGRHQCQWVVDQLKEDFLASGGDPQWLQGLEMAPRKLRDINEVNKILAHRPWLLNKSHIECLLRGVHTWSLGELLQALTILAHFHSLCSFVYSCRFFNSQSPRPAGSPVGSPPNGLKGQRRSCHAPLGGVPVERLMEKMRTLTQRSHSSEELSPAEKTRSYRTVKPSGVPSSVAEQRPAADDVARFVLDADFSYADFRARGQATELSTFRAQDYSWEDHGFSLVNRLYSDVGEVLDDKFRTAYHLTYLTMGKFQDVDTSLFRRAVWRYSQCLYGIRHDDYDYSIVNQLLDRSLKSFIKTVCAYPERLDAGKLRRVMAGFHHSEKVHVAILCTEARLQSELLYALRAVMRYTT